MKSLTRYLSRLVNRRGCKKYFSLCTTYEYRYICSLQDGCIKYAGFQKQVTCDNLLFLLSTYFDEEFMSFVRVKY